MLPAPLPGLALTCGLLGGQLPPGLVFLEHILVPFYTSQYLTQPLAEKGRVCGDTGFKEFFQILGKKMDVNIFSEKYLAVSDVPSVTLCVI